MNTRIQNLLDTVLEGKHKQIRRTISWQLPLAGQSPSDRATLGFCAMLAAEQPAFLPEEKIAFIRTVANIPELYKKEEMEQLRKTAFYAEKGCVFNITPDYGHTLAVGLDARKTEIYTRLRQVQTAEERQFLNNALLCIDAVLNLADRYCSAAQEKGLQHIAETFEQVPRKGAQTFLQALQFLRILHYSLWCEGEYHNGLGRIDCYLYPYLKSDLEAGRLDRESALELLEEFFISCNRDSDLYIGVQQGDNGQSVMLGGVDAAGHDAFNTLSELCLKASCELKVIDPKINLRVSKTTPLPILEAATELTKAGIGFPQYANDDVVIPGLTQLGYRLEDARNYTVAACWEFIIPGLGMDIPNIDAVSFPAVVDTVMRTSTASTFNAFMDDVKKQLNSVAEQIEKRLQHVKILPGPFISVLCDGCIERAKDVSQGNRYNNFGIHGTGISVAADSLSTIQKWVYAEKKLSLRQLVAAVDADFTNFADMLALFRTSTPKMGNDCDDVDEIAVQVLDAFADSWKGRRNCRGGIFRPGTGSAMYYIWHANALPATPDGRLKGEPFSANYAPSLNVPIRGPISLITSFTKPHLMRVVNGGPLTIELHDSAFRFEDGVAKVARLVKYFIDRGGHQLQINAVNREQLLDAQRHPEKYRHLIVRVWGWSGYFVELDKPYQDQIIQRIELSA